MRIALRGYRLRHPRRSHGRSHILDGDLHQPTFILVIGVPLKDPKRGWLRKLRMTNPVKFSNGWKAACAALLVVVPISAFGMQNPPSEGREVTKLYTDACAGCHGADMSGGSASSLIDGKWRYGGDDASIARSIRDGHADAGMPPMGKSLNEAEIRALVVYIHERSAAFERDHTKYNAPSPGVIVQSETESFKLEPVMETGLSEPWAIAFLPDGEMLVTERAGRLRIIQDGRLLPESVRGTPPVFGGEGGLLDVALHPQYSQPGKDWIYLSYGDKSPDDSGMTAILRAHLRDGALVDQQQIFKADLSKYRSGGMRFGSRLLFDRGGHLFFSIGDRAHPGDEQDLSCPNGKCIGSRMTARFPKTIPLLIGPAHCTASGPTVIATRKGFPSTLLLVTCGNRSMVRAEEMS